MPGLHFGTTELCESTQPVCFHLLHNTTVSASTFALVERINGGLRLFLQNRLIAKFVVSGSHAEIVFLFLTQDFLQV